MLYSSAVMQFCVKTSENIFYGSLVSFSCDHHGEGEKVEIGNERVHVKRHQRPCGSGGVVYYICCVVEGASAKEIGRGQYVKCQKEYTLHDPSGSDDATTM